MHEKIGGGGASLGNYAPYEPPFIGVPSKLSTEQREANLSYLIANRASRLATLGSFLRQHGIDVTQALVDQDPTPQLDKIFTWAKREWPTLYDPVIATQERWLASTRTGPEIVYSLLMDLAIFFGELIVAKRSRFAWSLDLDRANKEMISFRRIVVQAPKGGPFPAPLVVDVEYIVVANFFKAGSHSFLLLNDLTRPILQAAAGEDEKFWLQKAGLPW